MSADRKSFLTDADAKRILWEVDKIKASVHQHAEFSARSDQRELVELLSK